MAWGVNFPLLLTNPESYILAGSNALIPIYRWFFTQILPLNPQFFISLLILYETCVGVFILCKGKWTRIGLIMGTIFCIGIALIGLEEITSPLLALGIGLLLRIPFTTSIVDSVRSLFLKKAHTNGSIPPPATPE